MHVVVLGAGYAGISLVQRLERRLPSAVELTIVDERETHLVQHLLHRTLRTPGLAEQLVLPIDSICSRATHRQARVTGIDPDRHVVELDDGSLAYDVAAICLGASTDYHGLPGVEAHATPFKRLEHANRVREEFDRVAADGGRVIVGGAGLSGIQVAGELAELARAAPETPAVVLLERESTVAPAFPAPFRSAVRDELERRGVDIRTGTTVERADESGVTIAGGERIEYDQFVWTGGIRGQEPLDGDRPTVRATLRLADATLGLGDAVRVIDADGAAVEATAQAAVSQARTAATNVQRLVSSADGEDNSLFEPRL